MHNWAALPGLQHVHHRVNNALSGKGQFPILVAAIFMGTAMCQHALLPDVVEGHEQDTIE